MGALGTIRAYASLFRPYTLLSPVVGAVAFGLLGHGRPELYPELALLLAAGAWTMAVANAASNVINQAYDLDIDRVNRPGRPIPAGRVSRDEAIFFGVLLYGIASTSAFLLDRVYGIFVQVILLFTWLYSVPPVRLRSRLLLSNLAIATPRGGLGLLASYWLTAHAIDAVALAGALVFALYIFGGNTAKDFPDVAGDRQNGVRNFVTALGPDRAWLVMHACMLGALALLAGLVLGGAVPRGAGLALAITPLQAVWARKGPAIRPEAGMRAWRAFYACYSTAAGLYALGPLFLG